MHTTFSIMPFHFMSAILFYGQHMCNLPFYVQHESTKCIQHSILLVFILMSNILFLSNMKFTKCMRFYFMSNIPFYIQHINKIHNILCPAWIYEIHGTFKISTFYPYVQHTILCPICICKIHILYNTCALWFYVQHMPENGINDWNE